MVQIMNFDYYHHIQTVHYNYTFHNPIELKE